MADVVDAAQTNKDIEVCYDTAEDLACRAEVLSLLITHEFQRSFQHQQPASLTTHALLPSAFTASRDSIFAATTAPANVNRRGGGHGTTTTTKRGGGGTTTSQSTSNLSDSFRIPETPRALPLFSRVVYHRFLRRFPFFGGRGEEYVAKIDEFVEKDYFSFVAAFARATRFDLLGMFKHYLMLIFFAYPDDDYNDDKEEATPPKSVGQNVQQTAAATNTTNNNDESDDDDDDDEFHDAEETKDAIADEDATTTVGTPSPPAVHSSTAAAVAASLKYRQAKAEVLARLASDRRYAIDPVGLHKPGRFTTSPHLRCDYAKRESVPEDTSASSSSTSTAKTTRTTSLPQPQPQAPSTEEEEEDEDIPRRRDRMQELRYTSFVKAWDEFLKCSHKLLVSVREPSQNAEGLVYGPALFDTCSRCPTLQDLPEDYQEWCDKAIMAVAVTADNVLDDAMWRDKIHSVWNKLPLSLIVGSLRIINPIPFVDRLLRLFVWRPRGMQSLLQKLMAIFCAYERTERQIRELKPLLRGYDRDGVEQALKAYLAEVEEGRGMGSAISDHELANMLARGGVEGIDGAEFHPGRHGHHGGTGHHRHHHHGRHSSRHHNHHHNGQSHNHQHHQHQHQRQSSNGSYRSDGSNSAKQQQQFPERKSSLGNFSGDKDINTLASEWTRQELLVTYARRLIRRSEKSRFVEMIGSKSITDFIVHLAQILPPMLTEMWACINMAELTDTFFKCVSGCLETLKQYDSPYSSMEEAELESTISQSDDRHPQRRVHDRVIEGMREHIQRVFEKGYPFVHELSKKEPMGPNGIHAMVDWMAREFGQPFAGDKRCVLEMSVRAAVKEAGIDELGGGGGGVDGGISGSGLVLKGLIEAGVDERRWIDHDKKRCAFPELSGCVGCSSSLDNISSKISGQKTAPAAVKKGTIILEPEQLDVFRNVVLGHMGSISFF